MKIFQLTRSIQIMASNELLWIRQQLVQSSSLNDLNPSVAADSAGNIYVSYFTDGQVSGGTNTGSNDIVVFKLATDGTVLWIKQTANMSTSGNDYNPSIVVDSVGACYVSYHTDGTVSGGVNTGTTDIAVLKMSTDGDLLWIHQPMNSAGTNSDPSMVLDSLGNVYITYQTSATLSGGTFMGGAYDIAVLKMAPNGTVLWVRQQSAMSSTGDDNSPSIGVDSADNIYVTFQSDGTISGGTNNGGSDIVVFKMASDGTLLWINQQTAMSTSDADIEPALAVDSAGNCYVSYHSASTVSGGTFLGGTHDIVVFKLSTTGDLLWIKQQASMSTSGADIDSSIAVDLSGNCYVAYGSTGTVSGGVNSGASDIVVFKLATDGSVQWIKQEAAMNSAGDDLRPTIALDSNGFLYVAYQTTGQVSGGTNAGLNDIVVMKFASSYPFTAPSEPIAVSASNVGTTSLTVSWIPPSETGGAAITGYTVTSSPGSFTSTVSGSTTSTTFSGLSAGTAYTFAVTASNAFGTSAPASVSVSTVASLGKCIIKVNNRCVVKVQGRVTVTGS